MTFPLFNRLIAASFPKAQHYRLLMLLQRPAQTDTKFSSYNMFLSLFEKKVREWRGEEWERKEITVTTKKYAMQRNIWNIWIQKKATKLIVKSDSIDNTHQGSTVLFGYENLQTHNKFIVSIIRLARIAHYQQWKLCFSIN